MNTFKLSFIPLVLASAFSATVHADDTQNVYDNRFYIAPMGSYALADDKRDTHNAYGGTLALGKPVLDYLEVEVIGTYLKYRKKEEKATVYDGGLGANVFMARFADNFTRNIFIHGDVEEGKRYLYNVGLGYDFYLGSSHTFAIRGEALYHHDDPYVEAQFNLGVRIALGAQPVAAAVAPPEPPVAIIPAVAPPPPPPPPPCQTPEPGQPISLEGCKTGDTIILRGVNFDFDKATLTLNAKAILDQVSDALKSRSDIKVEIDGHTDGKGSAPYNLKLSDRRAASVRQYLIGKGIDAGRMTSRGFGKTMPIADNATDEGREINRRVELKVVEANGGAGSIEVAPFTSDVAPGAEQANRPMGAQ